MSEDRQPQLPGVEDALFAPIDAPEPRTRRTLRDLLAEEAPLERSVLDSALTPVPDDAPGRTITLGFPSAGQLTRFVAGYHDHLLGDLGLGPLSVIAGGTRPSRRYYHMGRSATPDILLEAADESHVVVMVSAGPKASTDLRLGEALDVIAGLMGPVTGVLVTPSNLDEATTAAIWSHIGHLRQGHDVHWLRFTIQMHLDLE